MDKPTVLKSMYDENAAPTMPSYQPTATSLEDKVHGLRAENQLLGKLVRDLQADRDAEQQRREVAENTITELDKQIKKSGAVSSRNAALQRQLTVAEKELAGVRREKGEVEDAALDLQDELRQKSKRVGALEKRGAALEQRLSAMPGSEGWESQREALEAAEKECHALRLKNSELQGAVQRLSVSASNASEERRDLQKVWKAEWERAKMNSAQTVEVLESQLNRLRTTFHETEHGASAQLDSLRGRVEELEGELSRAREECEHAVHRATLAQQSEGILRDQVSDYLRRCEAMRREVLEAVERADGLFQQNGGLLRENKAAAEQLQAAEEALAAMRLEVLQLRGEATAARAGARAEALAIAQQGAAAYTSPLRGGGTGGTAGLGGAVGGSLAESPKDVLVRVQRHSIDESRGEAEALRQQAEEARYYEAQVRQLLSDARARQADSARALELELRRVHMLERLRVADVRELHDLEKRRALLQQEAWHLRDLLAAQRVVARAPSAPEGHHSNVHGGRGGAGLAAGAGACAHGER